MPRVKYFIIDFHLKKKKKKKTDYDYSIMANAFSDVEGKMASFI